MRTLLRIGRAPLLVGLLARVVLIVFAEPFYGDAPIRLALAWRLQEHPHLGWSWPDVFQFGPFPLHLGALASFADRWFGPPTVSLLAGTLSILVAMRVASRFAPTGPDAAPSIALVGWLVALGPLHLQASTTFVSEMVYLLAALVVVESTLAGNRLGAFLSLFAASTSRYDVWLVLPGWVLLWAYLRGFSFRKLVEAALLAGAGPLSILVANGIAVSNPLAPMSWIQSEHVLLGARVDAELGPILGRARAVVFWFVVLFVVLGPVAGAWLWRGLGARLRDRSTWPLWLLGWGPPAVYVLRGLATNGFFPMSRLAIVPGTFLAVMTPWVGTRLRAWVLTTLLWLDVGLLVLTLWGTPDMARRVSTVTPLAHWPADLRVAADWFREAPDQTEVESTGDYEELPLLVSFGHSNPHAFVLDRCGVPKPWAIVRVGGPFDPGESGRVAVSGRFARVKAPDCVAGEGATERCRRPCPSKPVE